VKGWGGGGFATCAKRILLVTALHEGKSPWRRIMVTSSLNEISTGHAAGNRIWRRGNRYSVHPFLQQSSGQIFKDDVDGFFLHLRYWLHDG
jgi:hypothetical protein